jgi:hypothetical protein
MADGPGVEESRFSSPQSMKNTVFLGKKLTIFQKVVARAPHNL